MSFDSFPKTPSSSSETVRGLQKGEVADLRAALDQIHQVLKEDPRTAREKLKEVLQPIIEKEQK